MSVISVDGRKVGEDWEFDVEVIEGDSSTRHKVAVDKAFYNNLEVKVSVEEVVRKSFEFLLERETKEMIYKKFNIEVIGQYFPEYLETLVISFG